MLSCSRPWLGSLRLARTIAGSSIARGLPPTIGQLLASPPSPDVDTTITAFVKSVRKQKHVAFANVSDGSSPHSLQAVIEAEKTSPDLIQRVTAGASVKLTGKLVKSMGAGQEYDLRVEQLEVLGACDPAVYPLQKKTHTHEHLRAHTHLRPRTDETAAVLRTRALLTRSICEYFNSEQFIQVHAPIITSNDTEGAGETFRVAPASDSTDDLETAAAEQVALDTPPAKPEFFGIPAHLSVSAQLHLEALSHALSRVYTLAPAFRAERSQTNRHLAEFWMLEAELQMTSPSLALLLDVVEGEHERHLARDAPVFVTDYPAEIKPFYMRANDADPERQTVACFDLLVPGIGELAGGSVREERIEQLDLALKEKGLDIEEYGWYRDLRIYGGAPHAGFGMGFERMVSFVAGLENVRECIAFPRTFGRMGV
ncbi:asparaginyl-tRNA synthetase [Ceratobasidium sp. 370]|nr:asparaginyl-tRNA synthetase [Ceratobasidium sp. 370]